MKSSRSIFTSAIFLCALSFSSCAFAAPANLVVIGNSLTKHAPYPAIGWEGNWGMAASSEEQDYAHVLKKMIESKSKSPVELTIENRGKFERGFWLEEEQKLPSPLEKQLKHASYVVIQLGDNVSDSDFSTYDFKKSYQDFIQQIRKTSPQDSQIFCLGPWWHNDKKAEAIKNGCIQGGGSYIEISDIARAASSKASSERSFKNNGVASHPGNRGMKQIAEKIYKRITLH